MEILKRISHLKEVAKDVTKNAKTRSLYAVLPDVGNDRMRLQLLSSMTNNIEKNCRLALKGKREMPTPESVLQNFHEDKSFVEFCRKECDITDNDVKGITEMSIAKFKDQPLEIKLYPDMPKTQPCPQCKKQCKINLRLENGAKYLCFKHGEFEAIHK